MDINDDNNKKVGHIKKEENQENIGSQIFLSILGTVFFEWGLFSGTTLYILEKKKKKKTDKKHTNILKKK